MDIQAWWDEVNNSNPVDDLREMRARMEAEDRREMARLLASIAGTTKTIAPGRP